MVNDRGKEIIGKDKEIAEAASEATEPALPTTGQTSGCLTSHQYIASTGDTRKHCLGQCLDLKLLTPWPTRSAQRQLYQVEVIEPIL